MLNLVILLLGILFLIGGIYMVTSLKTPKYVSLLLILIGAVVIVFSQCIIIIPSGYSGVRIRFGQVSPEPMQNGINYKIPFVESVKKVNNKQQDIKFNGQTWSETAERTAIYYEDVTVTYQIAKDKSAWIYTNVDNYTDKLITSSLVASAIKASSKELSDTDATNRGKIEPLSMQKLQESLDGKYGEETIHINKVVIESADFDEDYNAAIAEKQNAQIAYEKQQIENKKAVEQAKAEADAKVKQAEGEANAKKIAAEADAEATKIQAAAQAEANKELSQSITQELIDMELAEARQEHGWVTVQGADNVIVDEKE